jgi:NAD(P)H-hydrate epimerase
MRAIDAKAVENYRIPGVVLMENAGVSVARCSAELLQGARDKRICIFTGKGNNGGDGYVAARHLHNWGGRVKVFLIGAKKNDIGGDAGINLEIVEEMGIEILEIMSDRDWDKIGVAITFADCLIDAMLGTGFYGELTKDFAKAVEVINQSGKPVVAVDIPSGVEADTGQVRTSAVRADKTVTFGLYKPGLLLHPGAGCAGEVILADIGLPVELLQSPSIKQNLVISDNIRTMLPVRSADAHKGSAGRVLIIAGSRGLTGAAALTSMAALRAGAGLVTLGVAETLHDIMEVKLTEVMTCPLPGNKDGFLEEAAAEPVLELARRSNVLAIGPGLGAKDATAKAIKEIIIRAEVPLVVDADALNALAGCMDILQQSPALAVVTPHPGEMARLIGMTAGQVNSDRINIAREFAVRWDSIVVLKGAPTITAFPDGEIFVNSSGNAGMATGGTGDVLTGVIASFIAQGLSSHDAAVAGVYIHGLAGDITAKQGASGLVAGDLLHKLPAAILAIQA